MHENVHIITNALTKNHIEKLGGNCIVSVSILKMRDAVTNLIIYFLYILKHFSILSI